MSSYLGDDAIMLPQHLTCIRKFNEMLGSLRAKACGQIPGLNPGHVVETTRVEYGRSRGNFW